MDEWSRYVGGRPTLLANNLADARRALVVALNLADREPVLLPANATHSLVEAVKHRDAKPVFGALDQNLSLSTEGCDRVAWLQPPVGLPCGVSALAEVTVLDHGDSLPQGSLARVNGSLIASVEIYGLHLSSDSSTQGALLVFNDDVLYARVMAQREEVEALAYARAALQLERLRTFAPRQLDALMAVRTGLQEAAGLRVLPVSSAALAQGVAVQIPTEGPPSTFWMYARGENTAVRWLPELRPIHCAALATCPRAAASLEEWLFVPVSPDDDDEANLQAILGIVKTAEHLGLRWRTDPARAVQYAALLDAMYGPDHDAYRPAFSTDGYAPAETTFDADEFHPPSCRM